MSDLECSICCEEFTEPVALPCGHVFCAACVRRKAAPAFDTESSSEGAVCPTCGSAYPVHRAVIPPYLRAHFLPPVRPLFFEERSGKVDDSAAPGRSLLTPAATDVDVRSDTASESPSASFSSSLPPTTTNPESSTSTALAALHLACATWRRRAETHAAGNARLLLFARKARDCAIRMRTERDEARNECVLLRRLMGEILEGGERGAQPVESGEGAGLLLSPSPFAPVRDRSTSAASVRAELPMFLQQSQEASGDVHGENEVLGPPMKRRRVGHESENEKEEEEEDDVVG